MDLAPGIDLGTLATWLLAAAVVGLLASARLWCVAPTRLAWAAPPWLHPAPQHSGPLMAVMGSGGHTAEMIPLLMRLRAEEAGAHSRRSIVIAATDHTSVPRLVSVKALDPDTDDVDVIPRSREVGQPWASSALTTAWATAVCLAVVLRRRPRLLLTNGPGTCVPVAIAVWVWRLFGVVRTRVVFVESACRVTSLSLTGRIMHAGLADRVLVQWPQLLETHTGVELVGLTV